MPLLIELFRRNAKFHSQFYVFVYVTIVLLSRCESLKSDNFICKLVDNCSCTFENEEGYNLSALSANRYGLNSSIGNLTFFVHPCTDISIGNNSDRNECYNGSSVCLYNHTSQVYKNLGLAHEVMVENFNGISGPVFFVYSHNKSVTRVQLKCDVSSFLKVAFENGTDNHELLLHSPSACRQRVYLLKDPIEPHSHLSTGSVLVIMFIVFSSLYFVGGALVLKFLRGAEGREMIPNYDFWISLPGLVKEGFVFTLSGCRTVQAYDRI